MNNRGMPIIGLGERIPEYEQLPLQWMPHIQVSDVATSTASALALGGVELMHGKDDEGNSQWAVLLDPNGAAFGLIPVVPEEAMSQSGDGAAHSAGEAVGCIAGLELTVPDARATAEFYRQVVGWSAKNPQAGGARKATDSFEMICDDGHPVAEIFDGRDSSPDLPQAWLIRLPVGDLQESLRRVQESGGDIIESMRKEDGAYRSVVIQDPVGVCLSLETG
jgi:predicted enzyme related to lactoylglutathione lyase